MFLSVFVFINKTGLYNVVVIFNVKTMILLNHRIYSVQNKK